MCGICGEYSLTGEPVRPEYVDRMITSLKHRGPDARGLYCDGPIGLGHARLSIIDLSASGNQPMWSADGSLCIVYNGEVYNYREIREALIAEDYAFGGASDTEVVVNAIHCWGLEEALKRFIGMFAFALWNKDRGELVLCRDRAGIKPLYYYQARGRLLFGSEVKALSAHPAFVKELDLTALGQHFINGYILAPRSIFKDVHKLLPGHYLIIDKHGQATLKEYWRLAAVQRNSYQGSFEEATEQLEALLLDAFTYRLVSDVPVGLFLSGGVDSSLVSAILKKKANVDILNITIGFQEKAYDESPKAKNVSESLGLKHIVHYVGEKEAQDSLMTFCEIYDEPYGDTSGIPTYILSRLARQHVKVALSADGGDEQFYGYENYSSYESQYHRVMKWPLSIRLAVSRFLEHGIPYRSLLSTKAALSHNESFFPQEIGRYEKMLRLLKVRDKIDLLRLMNEKAWSQESIRQFFRFDPGDVFANTVLDRDYLEHCNGDLADAMMRTDYQSFLRDDILVKVDRASMAVSLECRDPFLDHRIAEFAFSLPLHYVYGDGEHKKILKKILRKWVSEDIISSPKRGFMIPLYYWLRGVWKPFVLEYLSPAKIRKIGILDEKKVAGELNNFYRYQGCRAEKIWMMMNFQMWAERWYCA